jgi:hypothetical protein
MNNATYKDLFKDYYFKNKGTLFKSFEISINNFHYSYDIYWGDPNIIFDEITLKNTFPLAVTIIPHRYNYPNSRIFLHEKLETKYKNVFEMVIAHEIGHLWLHDIVGFNNPHTSSYMSENDSEIWADYFSYCFFVKYKFINCLEDFNKILEEAHDLQTKLYDIYPQQKKELFYNRIEKIQLLDKKINSIENNNTEINRMVNTIKITLNALGDIFK